MNKSESKYFNTAERMDKALLELLEKKDFSYITVKGICEKAEVNRSTFYLHYETIGDLLEESIDYIQKKFLSGFQGKQSVMPKIQDCSHKELMWITPDYLRPYLQFIKDYQQLYRAAMERPALFNSEKIYRQMFLHIFDPVLERFDVPVAERRYIMVFYLKGISGIIGEWLKEGCKDPIEQIITIIQKYVPRKSIKQEEI